MSLSAVPTPSSPAASQAAGGPLLSVVIPTLNEVGNVPELVSRLAQALNGVAWEVIFVDDNSPDGTATVAKRLSLSDRRVRCIRRVERRGLAGACIEGILSSAAPYVAVMDADLQHDETILPRMLARLQGGDTDLVVGTRYVEGGSAAAFDAKRGALSRIATKAAQRLLGTTLSDPMSGFFMLRREVVEEMAGDLTPEGFKILLDIVTTAGGRLRVAEEPFVFRSRFSGESKFDSRVGIEFLGLLLGKMTFGVVNPRFLLFGLVGATGIGVHLIVLKTSLLYASAVFPAAQSLATFTAMGSNFVLNNFLTYRDRRLKGLAMLKGFAGFCLIGAAGAVTNVGIASYFYAERPVWWLAGLTGALMGLLWNYTMSSRFVWHTR